MGGLVPLSWTGAQGPHPSPFDQDIVSGSLGDPLLDPVAGFSCWVHPGAQEASLDGSGFCPAAAEGLVALISHGSTGPAHVASPGPVRHGPLCPVGQVSCDGRTQGQRVSGTERLWLWGPGSGMGIGSVAPWIAPGHPDLPLRPRPLCLGHAGTEHAGLEPGLSCLPCHG